MKRRAFLPLVAGAVLLRPVAGFGQRRTPVIGVLESDEAGAMLDEFRKALADLGYVDGKSIRIEARTAGGNPKRLRALAEELVRLKVDVIVTRLTPPLRAAKEATQTIPIVMAGAGAPVESGLIASLARPGGNVTGMALPNLQLSEKRLQLFRELLPSMRRLVVISTTGDPFTEMFASHAERAGRDFGVQTRAVTVSGVQELDAAFADMARDGPDAVLMQANLPVKAVVDLALENRLPLFSTQRGAVDAGALMSYAGRLTDIYRGAAVYVDKILKGASPASLPVEESSRFELVINMKTARALGLAVPAGLLAQADEIIE